MTAEFYMMRVKSFIYFHDNKHPKGMGKVEIEVFLPHLASEINVAESTQN